VLDAELLYAACYARARNDTTPNSLRVFTVSTQKFPDSPTLTSERDVSMCPSKGADITWSNGLVERSVRTKGCSLRSRPVRDGGFPNLTTLLSRSENCGHHYIPQAVTTIWI
jgi:hypothetical protein